MCPDLFGELSAGVGVSVFGAERNAHLPNRIKNEHIVDKTNRTRQEGVRAEKHWQNRVLAYILLERTRRICQPEQM